MLGFCESMLKNLKKLNCRALEELETCAQVYVGLLLIYAQGLEELELCENPALGSSSSLKPSTLYLLPSPVAAPKLLELFMGAMPKT
ncbi:hypothetical protein SLEP1_g48166 [Rubroshorea leprosula]|uniref:Uncharacterized protein n=1 Tax=Rubroshorea leprosula TaxID=152421 RepID=A0AAV5LSW5_9ROSI|nr:hypothetical protein SLEP1_g48166 [Rubroshorea leprosula]